MGGMCMTVAYQVPPPSIDFVLPSPTIGLPCLPIVDPPWTPHFKTKVEEVTINQTESVCHACHFCQLLLTLCPSRSKLRYSRWSKTLATTSLSANTLQMKLHV